MVQIKVGEGMGGREGRAGGRVHAIRNREENMSSPYFPLFEMICAGDSSGSWLVLTLSPPSLPPSLPPPFPTSPP